MSGELHSGVQDLAFNNNNKNKDDNEVTDEDIKSTEDINAPLCCKICNIKVTSEKILQRHLEGRKHRLRMERRGKCFTCDLCDITANSEIQLNIHLNSSKHKAKLAKKEYVEFTKISANSKGVWIIVFCLVCIFLNLLLLFKVVM